MNAEKIGKAVREVQAEYLGHDDELDDYSDAEIGRNFVEEIERNPDILDNLLHIQSKYDPNLGRMRSWWRRKQSKARTWLLIELSIEASGIRDLLKARYALEDLIEMQALKRIQAKFRREDNKTGIAQLKFNRAVIMSNAILLKLSTDKAMSLPDFMEWRKQVEFDEQELEFSKRSAIQNIQLAAFAKHMADYQQLDIIQARLDTLNEEIYRIGVSPDEPEEVKRKKIEDREQTILATKEHKTQIEDKLRGLATSKPAGNGKATEPPANPKPPLGRDK